MLLRDWISRRCDLDSARVGALDCSLHQSRGFGLFDKLCDIGKPCSLAFRNCHCPEGSVEAISNDPRVKAVYLGEAEHA